MYARKTTQRYFLNTHKRQHVMQSSLLTFTHTFRAHSTHLKDGQRTDFRSVYKVLLVLHVCKDCGE